MNSKVIFNQSKDGLKPYRSPKIDIKREKLSKYINKNFLRDNKARLPEVSEPEVVRHFSNLSV